MNEIGNRIRLFREGLNMTQAELGEAVGVKESTISQWETGSRGVKISYGFRLCKIFDKTLDDIFFPNNLSECQEQVV